MKKLTPHTHKPNNTQPHDKKHACNNNHNQKPCMQQQQQQQTHTYTTITIKNPTPWTIIGCCPHPRTCVWVGWVFI